MDIRARSGPTLTAVRCCVKLKITRRQRDDRYGSVLVLMLTDNKS